MDERAKVISLNTSGLDVNKLKARIEDELQHTFLETYINKPVIDEEKLRLLNEIINATSLSEYQKERYIVTTMLVQVALDTHDLVPSITEQDESPAVKLQKQLRVLAGDYYSGLYYLLLAEIDDFDLIHQLATAIKEINEYKMDLYYQEALSFEEYMKLTKRIDALLIVRIAAYLQVPTVEQLAEDWLIVGNIVEDIKRLKNGKSSSLIKNWANGDSDSTLLISYLDKYLQKKICHVNQKVKNLTSNQQLAVHIRKQLTEVFHTKTSIAEKG